MSDRSSTSPAPALPGTGGKWRLLSRRRTFTARAGDTASPQTVRIKQVRRGPVGSFLAPVGFAVGVSIIAITAGSFGTTWWTSLQRDAVFSKIVQEDGTIARILGGGALKDEVTILVRNPEGELVHRVAERSAADRHLNAALARLDDARTRAKALAHQEIDQLFVLSFNDRDAAIEDYADWFFAWRRPYVVLKEAAVSALGHLAETGEYEPITTAVERDLQTYFMTHYSDRVLKPGQRDPLIADGFEQIARRAHERWRQAVVSEDLRLQLFLAEHTEALDDPASDAALTDVALDWDAQRFQAPMHVMDDKGYDGLVSLVAVGTGGTIGALALGPVLDRAASRAFAGIGRRYASAFAGRVAMAEAGAVAGTAVQPVGGTVLGAAAGAVFGLAVDYLVNEAGEAVNRDGFVAANQDAVDATITAWKANLTRSVDAGIDRWFDDSRAALVQ
mgnify:CR=1 FL=1